MRIGGALLGLRAAGARETPGRLPRLHTRTLIAGWILARPFAAGAWGLFTGLIRPNGFLVSIPLLVLALQQRPVNRRLCLTALLPIAGMLLFSLYLMSLTGRPLAWLDAHAAWGRTPPPWQGAVAQPLEQLEQGVR